MDTHVKEGQLYVQHQKFGKKWKKNWFVLYPASQNGIARLEYYDSPSGGGGGGGAGGGGNEKTRKLDKKIIRLSECISILPAVTESCPKDNMAAFCVETNDKTHVFAAEKSVTTEWVDKMCEIAFQGGSGAADSNGGQQDLQMSENLIYYSREEVNEFWVSVQRTEASERCGLSASYWLKADSDVLILKDPKTKRNVLVWPYKLLRRYGRDRVMFSFEAGRRCDSGPGSFTFETKQGNEIFQLVEQAIQSQKALAEERHLSCPVNFDPDCPSSLQHLRNVAAGGVAMTTGGGGGGMTADGNSCGGREPDGDSGGSKPGSADGVLGRREGGDGGGGGRGQGGGGGGGGGHKGRSLPEPPPILGVFGGGGTPPRSPMPRQGAPGVGPSSLEEHSGLYSEPADSVRLPPHSADCLYSDPVDSIKGQGQTGGSPVPTPRLRPVGDEGSGGGGAAAGGHLHGNNNHMKQPELYCYLYNQVSLELSQRTGALTLEGSGSGVGGGRGGGGGGGRGVNSNRRQAEGASSPPALPLEHIYDEPEGCAKGGGGGSCGNLSASLYDEARPADSHSRRRQEEAAAPSGQEGNSYSVPSHGKQYTQPYAHPQPDAPHTQLGPSRGGPLPPAPRWPKPTTAPKPNRGALPRKEPLPLPPLKPGGNVNNNNGNFGGGAELYSKVSKQKPPPPNSWYSQHPHHQGPLRSPDIIYDNLGDI
ncbi:docking protein 1b [Centroberyx affinis]|uniref:docking protein 1b n=1 Tax=Centroberyx affinis TaxID=166261 RepID=UPI003A5BE3F3